MDQHLNIFYSYNQGNFENSDKIQQLEDNLTRAFISTLKNIDKLTQREIIKNLLPDNKLKSKEFDFDLQNTTLYDHSKGIKKYVLILQRFKSKISVEDLSLIKDVKIEKLISLLPEIKKSIKDSKEFQFENDFIQVDELESIYQLSHDNRPDAWIIGNEEVLLIETKIGSNKVSKYQIYRHITRKHGLRLNKSDFGNVEIINKTWAELNSVLSDVYKTIKNNVRDSFLIKQLQEYIAMTGQVLDLKYLTEKDGDIDPFTHKEQFLLFLNELDNELSENRNLNLNRKNRAKSVHLWELYSILDEKDKLLEDPHYSISFGIDTISISLTTKSHKQVKDTILDLVKELYRKKLNQKDCFLLRYSLLCVNYRLVDYVKGQIKGESHESLEFRIRFSEIKNNIDEICKIIGNLTKIKIYKQFEISFIIDLFNFSKIREDELEEEQIRYKNKSLLENPKELVKEFVNFIKETKHIFDAMMEVKKK